MKKGQSTVEYIFLIGVAAAALIAMLVYVGRSLQGRLRNQSEQLGALQYDPGKTKIHNQETKTTASVNKSSSSTTVVYGNMREPNKEGEALLEKMKEKQKEIDQLKDGGYTADQLRALKDQGYEDVEIAALAGAKFEGMYAIEGDHQAWVAFNSDPKEVDSDEESTLIFPSDGVVAKYTDELNKKYDDLKELSDAYEESDKKWKEREIKEDSTSSSSSSSESGETGNIKDISEQLGEL
ncbi:MAG: hypothetical protein PHS66_06675 [Candidatus Omnitrophica bacterium]|nr:hypothetical protein [Candidatus Omnitrophota bacterium]